MMAAANTEMVIVGRLGAPFGVKGWVHVSSFTDPPENLLDYWPWNLRRRGGWQPVEVEDIRPHPKGFVARLATIADRDAAFALKGAEIGVCADVLPQPAPGEYYWKDLIGLAVERLDGTPLGRVESLLETTVHDVLVIRNAGTAAGIEGRAEAGDEAGDQSGDDSGDEKSTEVLVPFVEAVIKAVELDRGRLIVDWDPDY